MNVSPIEIQHCSFDHTSSKYLQKISSCWHLVLSTGHVTICEVCRCSQCPKSHVTVADFGIPRFSGEWTSVALFDDLYFTGQYVNKSKL